MRKSPNSCEASTGAKVVLVAIASVLISPGPDLIAQTAPQTAPVPVLHRRVDAQAVEEADAVTISRGRTTLPPDASGAYSLGQAGELVEIDLEPHQLSGYISRLGDRMSDEGTPLTFFFASTLLQGRGLSFTTRQVHGVWFSFTGTIVRGNAPTRSQDGYYRLEGRLVLHDTANSTEQARDVSLPLMRQ